MGFPDESGMEGSGVVSYLQYFPEFDVVMASHEHVFHEGTMINGVLTAENSNAARTLFRITLNLERDGEKWKVTDRQAESFNVQDFEPDPAFLEKYKGAHERILENTLTVIGTLEGDQPLAGDNPVESYPLGEFDPKPMMTFLNRVIQHYAGTEVSCINMSKFRTNLRPGPITIRDAVWLFPFTNTVNKIKMTGRQLRKFMEHNAKYYQTFRKGDLTITIDPAWPIHKHAFFSGVCCEINVSKEPGHRIEKLTWPNGTPVRDEDEFPFACTALTYSTFLRDYGPVFSEEDGLPVMIDEWVRPDLFCIPFMIIDYIEHVLHGKVVPENENNWKITGTAWDEPLHVKAVKYLRKGWIPESVISDARVHCLRPIRLEHILEAEKENRETDA